MHTHIYAYACASFVVHRTHSIYKPMELSGNKKKMWLKCSCSGYAYLANKFFRIRGTGRRFVVVIAFRSTGQVGCRDSHSVMHARQNACSQTAACSGSSKTPAQIGHTSSSSTSPWNRVSSYPILFRRFYSVCAMDFGSIVSPVNSWVQSD